MNVIANTDNLKLKCIIIKPPEIIICISTKS